MNGIILMMKGFIIGIAKVVPGVSGALLAIILGLYEKGIDAIVGVWKRPKQYLPFLLSVGFGVLVAIVIGSHVIRFFLVCCYLPTMLFFIGLMIGGIPSFYRSISEKKHQKRYWVAFLISVFFVLFLSLRFEQSTTLTLKDVSWETLFTMGIIEMATTMIPGISGTAIFMLLGLYPLLLELFSMLGSLSMMASYLSFYLPFALGIGIGLFVIAYTIRFLFRHCFYMVNYVILGLSCSSICILLFQTFQRNYSLLEVIISLCLLLLGQWISKLFGENSHNETTFS